MSPFRKKLQLFIDSPVIQGVIIWLIILNTIFMGLETFEWYKAYFGTSAQFIEYFFVWIFLLEVVLKIIAHGSNFFKSGWNNFDFAIVLISMIPGNSAFRALRAIRTLRAFRATRLFGRIKHLRIIIDAMLSSLPRLGWLFFILAIIFYIFGILSTSLFAQVAPEQFGTLTDSIYSLFSLMTMEGWQDTVEAVDSPYAKWVFIPFMLLSSYIFLNLVVGIIVAAMEEIVDENKKISGNDQEQELTEEIKKLSTEISELKKLIADKRQ